MVAIDKDFDHALEYFCQYNTDLERYVAVSVCTGKYELKGMTGHNIKESERSRLTETRWGGQ